MTKRLLVTDGPDRGRAFSLPSSGAVRIGNNPQHADIALNDESVHELHCLLEVDEDRIVVRNNGDSTAVVVNGQPARKRTLRPGDVLRIGNSELRLEDPAGPKRPIPNAGLAAMLTQLRNQLPGQTFGNFEIGPVLGGGVRSVIFQAKDHFKAGRTVALKVLSPVFPANPTEMQQFVETIKGLTSLRHPNLVRIYRAGRTGQHCWLAYEFVEGESLAQVLAQNDPSGKVDWRQALRLGIHIGRGLDFLHQRRLVHRHITPANILLRGSDKVFKLSDVILGQILAGSALDAATLEARQRADLAYLSPEALNSPTRVDQLSDIYSLGAVISAQLTELPQTPPAAPEQTRARPEARPQRKPRQRGALPASPAEEHWLFSETLNWAKQRQSSIPPAFEAAVMRMTAHRPEDRYPTAAELVANLERIAEEEKVKV